jgi:hypothetical protein
MPTRIFSGQYHSHLSESDTAHVTISLEVNISGCNWEKRFHCENYACIYEELLSELELLGGKFRDEKNSVRILEWFLDV